MNHLKNWLSLALLVSACAFGQNLSQLAGMVSDPSGAPVSGAVVEISNTETGVKRSVKTDDTGVYVAAQMQPGNYRLTVTATGFSTATVDAVRLLVNTPATINIRLEIGAVTETVSVSAETMQVNTTDATIGNTIGTQPIIQLPSFARNVAGLLALQPGVNVFGNVNGGKSDQANITLDGVDVNDQMDRSAFTSVLRVTLDSVQEFRTTTTNANADQGRSSGAQVSLVTKSGTNEFHGSAYWYHRNTIHAANNWFNNRSGVNRPALLINIPGASVGGPIIKNKFFFFANWEQRNDRSAQNVSRVVPSLGIRNGNVNYPRRGGGFGVLTPNDIRAVDPAGVGVNQAVLEHFRSYPAPNAPELGDGLNYQGFRFSAPIALRWNTYTARFDYSLGTRHNFFVRGQLQNDRSNGAPQFPGDQPNSVNLTNAKGISVGHNALLSNSLVSTFRYGLTRNSRETTGIQSTPVVSFRGLDDRFGLTRGVSRTIPVHMLTQDFAWTKGKHDVRFGGVMRFIDNRSNTFARSFHDVFVNPGWMRNLADDIAPSDYAGGSIAYTNAMTGVLGLISQVTARYNYTIDGQVLNLGQPVSRNFKNEEYEIYFMDTWRVNRQVTITAGVRYSLMPPIYEANGNQISTNVPLGDWFDLRGNLGNQGKPASEAPLIRFIKHNDQGGRPIYPYHKDLIAPRIAVAYSPDEKTSIRAGWGMYYDIIGQPLARTYDDSAFGFATQLRNQTNQLTGLTAPRLRTIFDLPGNLLRPAPPGGFPQTFPTGLSSITNTIDDTLKMPYTMNMNFNVSREFGKGWLVQAGYVGRQSRRSLINRDLAMPLNLIDQRSGQTYFDAATQITSLARGRNPWQAVPRIPFFENLYASNATGNMSATQFIYQNLFRFYRFDTTTALESTDVFCDPVCPDSGDFTFYSPQFGALSAWSSVAGGNYHSAQVTVRKRFSQGLTLDLNYTLSKSQDLASVEENGGSFSGLLINSWNPRLRRAVSDYDQRHVFNAFYVYELPFGKGKPLFTGASKALDAFVGGWQLSGVWTQSTALPWSVGNVFAFPTNYNSTGFANALSAPPPPDNNRNAPAVAGAGGPNVWNNPADVITKFDPPYPGQVGSRNLVRAEGRANWDFALAKRFLMPFSESHSVQFRWEVYNAFNMVRFGGVNLSLNNPNNFGKYTTQANSPRQMQFALRYEF